MTARDPDRNRRAAMDKPFRDPTDCLIRSIEMMRKQRYKALDAPQPCKGPASVRECRRPRRSRNRWWCAIVMCGWLAFSLHSRAIIASGSIAYPAADWGQRSPGDVGLSADKLKALANFAGGRGCVVRNGYLVFTWGDP